MVFFFKGIFTTIKRIDSMTFSKSCCIFNSEDEVYQAMFSAEMVCEGSVIFYRLEVSR